MQLARPVSLVVLLLSCGDSGEPVVFAECPTPGQFVLEGELDGRTIAIHEPLGGYGFANALGEPGYLEVYTDTTNDLCEMDSDCAAGSGCVGNLCVVAPKMCTTAPDCGVGQPCIDGRCLKRPKITVYFEDLIAYGDLVAARGTVELPGEDLFAGNCETGAYSGFLKQSDDGNTYSFVLRDLQAAPFCGAAEIAGELRGCLQKAPD